RAGGAARPGARLPPQRLVDGQLPGPCDHAGGHQPEPRLRLAARSARPAAAHVNPPAVVQDIERLAGRFSGVLGVWSHSLTSGEMVEWNAQDVFPAASAIKLPILYEVYRQAGEGRYQLTDTRTVEAADIVPGSGVLKDLTPGVALPVRDLATLMIVVSDNTAANLMIDLVGIDAINHSMEALGLTATVMEYKFFHAPPNSRGARSTPADLGRLMTQIADHKVLTPGACEEMLGSLRRPPPTDQITGKLPAHRAAL